MTLHSWKFAADAVWEKALTVDARQPVNLDAVRDWIMGQPQNVALEAIFAEGDMPGTMFGIRIISLAKAEQASRVTQLLSKSDPICSEADFLAAAADVFPEYAMFPARSRRSTSAS